VDYLTEDFTQDRGTYDVVLDTVGKTSFAACRPLLKPGGRYLSSELGRGGQNVALALLAPLRPSGRRVLFPIPKHDQEMVQHLKGLMESGEFTPVIDRTYPLAEIVEAYRYVETGRKMGNVVITVDG
jgi:NADPH:quinone reductase-like Zn-dependent oxidoreductase